MLIFNVLFLGLLASAGQNNEVCAPNLHELIPLKHLALSYARVHPNGDFILSEAGGEWGKTVLYDLRTRENGRIAPKIIKTPMELESVAVEGSWRLLFSPDEKGSFYTLTDLLEKKQMAKPIYVDSDFGGIYGSASTIGTPDSNRMSVRVVIGGQLRDYHFKFSDRNVAVTPEPIRKVCLNLNDISTPMLSKDGNEISAQTKNSNGQQSTKIYKLLANGNCELLEDLGYATSKASFSFPEIGKKGKVTFTIDDGARRTAYIYDRDLKKTYRISLSWEIAEYPGFTRDGRVFYYAWRGGGRSGIGIFSPGGARENTTYQLASEVTKKFFGPKYLDAMNECTPQKTNSKTRNSPQIVR